MKRLTRKRATTTRGELDWTDLEDMQAARFYTKWVTSVLISSVRCQSVCSCTPLTPILSGSCALSWYIAHIAPRDVTANVVRLATLFAVLRAPPHTPFLTIGSSELSKIRVANYLLQEPFLSQASWRVVGETTNQLSCGAKFSVVLGCWYLQ